MKILPKKENIENINKNIIENQEIPDLNSNTKNEEKIYPENVTQEKILEEKNTQENKSEKDQIQQILNNENEKMNLSEQIIINENLKLESNNNTTINKSQSFTTYTAPTKNINLRTLEKEEEEEENNYFYNDEINYTYKSTIPKKQKKKKIHIYTQTHVPTQTQTEIHKNKNLSCEIVTSTLNTSKKQNQKQITKKSRDNYNPISQGAILKAQSELDFISKRIHNNKYKIILNLLYKASEDKDKSSVFHRKCDQAQTTLTLIETKNGNRFGGFTKRTWRGLSIKKTDNDAFIFSVNKKVIYNIVKGTSAIGCYEDSGPFFTGGFKINDNAFNKGGYCFKKGLNFEMKSDFELTDGIENFDIKEIEVYEIKIA